MDPERLRRERLLSRAGFGPRPGDAERLAELGVEGWLARELAPASDGALESRLAAFPARDFDPVEYLKDIEPGRMRAGGGLGAKLRKQVRERTREVTRELVASRLVRAVHGERALREVLIDFWANHFNVFARKGLVGGLLPHYQRHVIEAHALGRFEDLLVAVAQSPAMLVYLDNWLSTAPSARARRRMRRAGGINENYARELLELHTLGVEGGYGQDDVVGVARVLTGWTLHSRRRPIYQFRRELHDSAAVSVLGERATGSGEEQGLRLLRRLARHPSTARFISRKLCARFVADAPPEELVRRTARVFLEREGDIPSVVASILRSPEFRSPQHRKFKTPLRFAVSALRATGGETDGSRPSLHALARLGEAPFFARAPTGYPEAMQHWLDPGAVLERMSWVFAVARGRVPGTSFGAHPPPGAERFLQTAGSDATAVALAAPEFQWA